MAEIDRRSLFASGMIAAAGAGLAGVAAGARPGLPPPAGPKTPTIFGTGGGFFAPAWEKPLFPQYLLALARRPSPRICWLGPASGESPAAFEQFARGMEAFDCQIRHFNIFSPATLDFQSYLMEQDIIFVGGGSTRNLIALWREWGFDKALRAAWAQGVVMSGGSAGMICWFEGGLTDSFAPVLSPVRATGILKGSANPHYNIRPDRKSRFRELIAKGELASPGLALDQDVGVLYRGAERVELVSANPRAGAFLVTRKGASYEEVPLPVRYLG